MSNALGGPNTVHGDLLKLPQTKEMGLLSDSNSYGYQPCPRNDLLPVASTSEDSRSMDQRLESSRRTSATTSLKELVCYFYRTLVCVFQAFIPRYLFLMFLHVSVSWRVSILFFEPNLHLLMDQLVKGKCQRRLFPNLIFFTI